MKFALPALFLFSALALAAPKHVILFIADDISWNDFGCYGNEAARTPNIDRLAANGLRFTNAYLTASSCSPSRSSIVTGRYPHNNGKASELHQPIAANLPWFPELLHESGFYTVLSGKNHMSREGEKTSHAWDSVSSGRTESNSGGHAHWVPELANRAPHQPFFGWYASYDAHRPWDGDTQWRKDEYGPMHDPVEVTVPPFLIDDLETRQDLASYYNEVTRFDHFIGETVAELERQGLLEDTLIFVLADNGRPFPRAKTRLHDSGMKTALVAHWPNGIARPGSDVAGLVSVIDLAPTILRLAAIAPTETMQGVDLSPMLGDPSAEIRKYAFSEHNWHDYEAHGRSVRDTQGYLYLENNRPALAWQGPADSVKSPTFQSLLERSKSGELTMAQQEVLLAPRPERELYYTPDDSDQLNNLIDSDDPTHAEARGRLEAVLAIWSNQTKDSVPENISADSFDRETGLSILKKGDRDSFRGTPSGSDRDAHLSNAPGPQ